MPPRYSFRALLVFALCILSSSARAAQPPAAVVDGVALGAGLVDLELSSEAALRWHRRISPEKMAEYRRAAIGRLIDQALLAGEAGRRGLAPGAAQIDLQVKQAAERMGGLEKLTQALGEGGLAITDYRGWIARRMAAGAVEQAIRAAARPTTAEVAAYYAGHVSEFVQPGSLEVELITFPVDPAADDTTAQTAKQSAEKAAALWRASSAVTGGAIASATGGRYEAIGRVHDGAAISGLEPIFSLAVSAPSQPLRTIYGWHVARVTKRFAPRPLGEEEAAPTIAGLLTRERGDRDFEALLRRLRAGATIVRSTP